MATTAAGRIPLNTWAIGFGLAGLANVWTAADAHLGTPDWLADALWVVTAISWVSLLVAHTVRGRAVADSLTTQLRNPLQGPVAALAPVVAMLLGIRLHEWLPTVATYVIVAALVTSALFAGWLLARWTEGDLELTSLHGGYLLPTVAAGYIGAIAASTIGLDGVAHGAFATATVFWLVLFPLLVARLMLRPSLPDQLVPTLAIVAAPPAVGGLAWFAISGYRADAMSQGLAGLTVLLVLMQLALLPRYRRLPFTLGFWSFTFPLAAVGTYAVDWLALWGGPGWELGAWGALVVVTGVIGSIALASGRQVRRRRGTAADDPRIDHTRVDPEPRLAARVGAVGGQGLQQ